MEIENKIIIILLSASLIFLYFGPDGMSNNSNEIWVNESRKNNWDDSKIQSKKKVIVYESEFGEDALAKILDQSGTLDLNVSAITEEDFELAMQNSKEWLDLHGYTFLDEFIDKENRDSLQYAEFLNDYNSYSKEQLASLAYQNDPRAQYYYGLLLLEENIDSAEPWLKKAISTGNFTSAVFSLNDAYLSKIDELTQQLFEKNNEGIMVRIDDQSLIDESQKINIESIRTELSATQDKIYIWALTAIKLNDPIAAIDIEFLSNKNSISVKELADYQIRSDQLFAELEQMRQDLNFGDFSKKLIDRRNFFIISNYSD